MSEMLPFLRIDRNNGARARIRGNAPPPCARTGGVTQVKPVRDIVTYDLSTPGVAMAIGALPTLAAGHEHRGLTNGGPAPSSKTSQPLQKLTASAAAPPTTTTTPSGSGIAPPRAPPHKTAPGNPWTYR